MQGQQLECAALPERAARQRLRLLLLTMLVIGEILVITVASIAVTRLHSPGSLSAASRLVQQARRFQAIPVCGVSPAKLDASARLRRSLDLTDAAIGLMLVILGLAGLRSMAVAEGKRRSFLIMTIGPPGSEVLTITL